jgi:hypothetical protein
MSAIAAGLAPGVTKWDVSAWGGMGVSPVVRGSRQARRLPATGKMPVPRRRRRSADIPLGCDPRLEKERMCVAA